MSNANGAPELEALVRLLAALPCWYVSGPGPSGTFQLALGAKVPRPIVLKNPAQSDEYRQFEGEANLLVWCAWRLDGVDMPVSSWDDDAKGIEAGLGRLVGAAIASVTLRAPAWDLEVAFTNGLNLRVFADHVPGDPSYDGNWEIWFRHQAVIVGPGTHWCLEPRGQPVAQAAK